MIGDREKLLDAMAEKDAITALRNLAIEYSKSGLGRQAIYDIYYEVYKELQNQGKTREEDILGDVMDMIAQTYAGKNLDLPT